MTTIIIKVAQPPFGVSDVEVEAEIIGELALHGSAMPQALVTPYTISHHRTGYACFGARTKNQARVAIKALLALPVDWSFDDPEVVRSWSTIHAPRINEIRRKAMA